MAEIKIVNIPPALAAKLDALAEQSQYPDRSSFLVAALQDYALFHDEYFLHCLPDIIKILAGNEVKKDSKQRGELLKHILASLDQSTYLMKRILSILSLDNEPFSEPYKNNGLNSDV